MTNKNYTQQPNGIEIDPGTTFSEWITIANELASRNALTEGKGYTFAALDWTSFGLRAFKVQALFAASSLLHLSTVTVREYDYLARQYPQNERVTGASVTAHAAVVLCEKEDRRELLEKFAKREIKTISDLKQEARKR